MPLIKPYRGTQLDRSHPLARGLVGCWLMNEGGGSKIYQPGSFGNSGSLMNQTSWLPEPMGYSLSFDGSDDHVIINNYSGLVSSKMSFVIRICPRAYPSGTYIHEALRKENSFHCTFYGSGWSSPYTSKVDLGIKVNGSTAYDVLISNSYAPLNVFTTLALTANGSQICAYVNGIATGSPTSYSGNITDTAANNLFLATYGTTARTNPGGSYRDLNCQISYVYIYNRALSAAEIRQLSREPFALFGTRSAGRVCASSGQVIYLSGTTAAQSNIAATAKVSRKLSGLIDAAATSSGNVRLTRKIAGQCAGLSHITATAKMTRRLSGTIEGRAGTSGSIKLVIRLSGSITGRSSLSGMVSSEFEGVWFSGSLNNDRSWLREALFNGMTAGAFKLGTVLSSGWFWMRSSGCSALYRGLRMEEIDFVNALKVIGQDDGEVSPPSYMAHRNGLTYFYVVRRFNGCGYQEETLSAAVKVRIGSDGQLVLSPNKIFIASAEQAAGKRIKLVWYYCPLEQESRPSSFNIYHDGRMGQINYENPAGSILYRGRRFYSWSSGELDAGEYQFAIRAEDAESAEGCPILLRTTVCDDEPAAVSILDVSAV